MLFLPLLTVETFAQSFKGENEYIAYSFFVSKPFSTAYLILKNLKPMSYKFKVIYKSGAYRRVITKTAYYGYSLYFQFHKIPHTFSRVYIFAKPYYDDSSYTLVRMLSFKVK